MDRKKNSAQEKSILKDQVLPPTSYSPLLGGRGGVVKKKNKKKNNELQTPLLLIRAEFQTSLWKDKTWKYIRNKRGNGHKSICC